MSSLQRVPVLLALLSSVLWGVADFLGGTAARRHAAHVVVGLSQVCALVVLVPVAAALGAGGRVLPGMAAGVVGVVALSSFYAALAGGTMGVVAPIASLGAVIPVAVGLVRGEQPSDLQLTGIVVAIAGVVLASGPELSGGASPRPLLLACVAAAGFGSVAALLAAGSEGPARQAVLTLLVMRGTSVALLAPVLVLALRRPGAAGAARRDVVLLAGIGLGDLAANAAFAAASRGSLLSVAAVLASLYPVVTVLLARHVHAEVLRPVQVMGVALALTGVALLAAG